MPHSLLATGKRHVLLFQRRRRSTAAGVLCFLLICIGGLSLLLTHHLLFEDTNGAGGGDGNEEVVPPGTYLTAYPGVDALDIYPPRHGESFIPFYEFLRCLDKRLNVDHRIKKEYPFRDINSTIPYIVLPVTVEQGDIKALMCNLTVQIRHIMYVQNGGVASMTVFLNRVQEAFAFTSRLKLPRMPNNYGYSVSLNVAMRDALSMPFDEVPFFFMANNDVRIPGGMLEDGLPRMYEQSLAGRAKIAELEAEVKTEPNQYTPERFREVPLRSTDDRHVLVTSRLLPDRIRYMKKEERMKAFADYYGDLYVDKKDQTAFWGLTRLAMEVTGFFDENCYPAYYEDTDYHRRLQLLGFKRLLIAGWEKTPMRHIGGGSILAVKSFRPAPEFRDVPPFIRGATFVIHRQFAAGYTYKKYGLRGGGWPDRTMNEPFPDEHLPLDAYVLNEQRNIGISELQRLAVLLENTPSMRQELKVQTPIDLMRQRNESLIGAINGKLPNRAEYYRNGGALRQLPSLDASTPAPVPATTAVVTTAAPTNPPETLDPLGFDENLTRHSERYISTEEFFDCLDKRLNVDHRSKTEYPFKEWNTTMPYLVMPVTVEQGDMKALMCNITCQIRHIMYVQNGGVASMTAFLDRVQEAFAFTSRLKLPRMPNNYGYSVSLNVAMRDALSMPFDEVPFLFMGNNDVRLPPGMLEVGLPNMYEQSLAARAKIAELEAEVKTEPNQYTPERFREVPLRSTDDRHVLVTSRLLPDRIRYMKKEERMKAFADYYGELYVDAGEGSAFWGMTRLSMETAGFYDENCYPAYFEDTDYIRRMRLLGFKPLSVPYWNKQRLRHIGGGSILAVKSFQPAPEFRDIPPFIRGATYAIRRHYSRSYIRAKYELPNSRWPDPAFREPYASRHLPLDAFVVNDLRNLAISEVQRVAVMYNQVENPKKRFKANSPLAYVKKHNGTLFRKIGEVILDGALYYRDGNALRLLS